MISGNWATLLLPIRKDETIDFDMLAKEIDYCIDAKVDGIYSNGTAGEFYTQSEVEFQKISQLLANKCHQAGISFQIGASHCHPQAALERIRYAATLNPRAIQVILPDWFPCTLDVALTFLNKAASIANGVELVLYNPPHAKVNLTANDLVELYRQIPTLVGFKLPNITPEVERSGLAKHASIFVAGHFLATEAYKGAKGSYSNVCCLNPRAAQAWTNDCLALKPQALELEIRIQQYITQEMTPYITNLGYSNAAVDKFMAAVGGWTDIEPTMRFPYPSIPSEDILKQRIIKNQLLPEFNCK
ncbi:dihydrodipicolinate synthase family protein [Vibrio sp. SA48]|uniref:dihydrodipicolinate synthase family protein n=1 Tax=Vibrio sp. S12_S33 TaxID=2720223 RepID=UPI001784C208|nr:dihydrodipicolinate synthase family protein [Vibrio sp. S12_S33]MBD1565953.1 dihydrodipicolinate synthase family protein [Vibrio sp. S12_S33]